MNIKEFASRLGISTATVSRAFGTKGRISEKTRKMIISRAEDLGYRANYHARNLSSKKSHTIAFFYPPLTKGEPDYFITEIIFGVSEASSRSSYPLQVHPIYPESTDFCKDIILNGSISGIIVTAGTAESNELVKTAKISSLPYVVVGHMSGENQNTVTFDNSRGAMLAGKYFKDTGRKNPAYVSGIFDKRKRLGFSQGLGAMSSKLHFDNGGSTFHDGFSAFRRVLKAVPDTDCVLCANDILAMGFIKAALTEGYKVPGDIAVIGFDDVKIARYFSPALTTIRLHLDELGEKSVNLLRRIMDGGKTVSCESVDCELIVRDSA